MEKERHKFITWFASNPVVANILIFTIVIAGLFTAFTIRKEGFPSFPADRISIHVPVLGSTPEDVERGITVKIEESLQGIAGIEHIHSISTENSAQLTIEAKEDYPLDTLLNEVKVQIDAIPNFPEIAENPIVSEAPSDETVLWVEIHGDASEKVLKETARKVRDELLRQPAISIVNNYGIRDYEISIEPSEEKLRRYNLTFDEVADAISANSLDLGSGSVHTDRGDIAIRTRQQAYVKKDFEKIPIRTTPDGITLLIKDVADVRDAFVDQRLLNRFNGQATISLKIETEGQEDIIKSVNEALAVVESWEGLPENVNISYWDDGSKEIYSRLMLLVRSGVGGVLLVLLILMLFVNFRLAFWVAVGIPVSLLGALIFFPVSGIDLTVNLISAFGFLVVLGIVVDDAIVIGESVYSSKEEDKHGDPLNATVRGVARVVTPATFGVITTIAAFLPLTQVSGLLGGIFSQIAIVVILCLSFSLIESKLILPSHLTSLKVHKEPKNVISKKWLRFQSFFSKSLKYCALKVIHPTLHILAPWRYAVFAGFIGLLALTVSLIPAGKLRFVFFPEIYQDTVLVSLDLEQGQSVDYLHEQAQYIADSAREIGEKYAEEFGTNPIRNLQIIADSNTKSSVTVEFTPSAERPNLPMDKIVRDWRQAVGDISGARKLSYYVTAGPPSKAFVINLESENLDDLIAGAKALKNRLREIPGVYDILDTFDSGQPEIEFTPNASGRNSTNLDSRTLAQNIRDAFYGREVQRVQRGNEEVKVMVRYPQEDRGKMETLRKMRIRLDDNTAAPLSRVANLTHGEALATIERYDNKRIVTVEASIDKSITTADEVHKLLGKDFYATTLASFPGLAFAPSGEIEEQMKSRLSLAKGFMISIFLVYILLAIPLKSYLKPLFIMSVIPFGIIGALLGHWLLGLPVSILSVFGIIALSGVVVNDSLILICRIDDLKVQGVNTREAIFEAAPSRFRAILLTSLTTFFGLAPLLAETDVQAQFLKPMAVSLGFGVLFATVITLFLLPLLLLIGKDIKDLYTRP